MSKSIIGTETEKNLLKAFAGESQARNRYEMFAMRAEEEGYGYVAAIFRDNANMECEHARRIFSFLPGRALEIQATYPAGKVGTTKENLEASIGGETEEAELLYPAFAKTAKEEGFLAVALLFNNLVKIETAHAKRFKKLLDSVVNETMYEASEDTQWLCPRCGYIHIGKKAPGACPVCLAKNIFQRVNENLWM